LLGEAIKSVIRYALEGFSVGIHVSKKEGNLGKENLKPSKTSSLQKKS